MSIALMLRKPKRDHLFLLIACLALGGVMYSAKRIANDIERAADRGLEYAAVPLPGHAGQ